MVPAPVEETSPPRNPREVGDSCLAALRRWLLGQEGALEEWLAPPPRRDHLSEGIREWMEDLTDYAEELEPGRS